MVKEYDSTIVKILNRLTLTTQVTRCTRRSDPRFDNDCKRENRRLKKRYRTSKAQSDRASWTSNVR